MADCERSKYYACAPTGEYRERFNKTGVRECYCGGGPETREHILFFCRFWIRVKRVAEGPRHRGHHGWTQDDIVVFLRLNPLAFTFTWAEILSQALEDMERGAFRTEACARLRCHTTDKIAIWRRLLQTSNVESILAHWRGAAAA